MTGDRKSRRRWAKGKSKLGNCMSKLYADTLAFLEELDLEIKAKGYEEQLMIAYKTNSDNWQVPRTPKVMSTAERGIENFPALLIEASNKLVELNELIKSIAELDDELESLAGLDTLNGTILFRVEERQFSDYVNNINDIVHRVKPDIGDIKLLRAVRDPSRVRVKLTDEQLSALQEGILELPKGRALFEEITKKGIKESEAVIFDKLKTHFEVCAYKITKSVSLPNAYLIAALSAKT